jgi:hypothetical protein
VFWVTIGSNTNLHLTLIYIFSVVKAPILSYLKVSDEDQILIMITQWVVYGSEFSSGSNYGMLNAHS